MTVQVFAPDQVRSLPEHLQHVGAMPDTVVHELRALAGQLDGMPVVPFLGAGASYDCGVRLARLISEDLYNDYMSDPMYEPRASIADHGNLAQVAQAIYNKTDQVSAVRAIRLHETDAWPAAEKIEPHFCGYRVLARMAREQMITTGVGFNYDCQSEAALDAEGFQRSPYTVSGQHWLDHARVITDKITNDSLEPGGNYLFYKAHGCAARYRERAANDETAAAETIVLRTQQLNTWRADSWMADAFKVIARGNVLLLVGFAAADPVIAGALTETLDDVFRDRDGDGVPRVVVLDPNPETPELTTAVQSGLNRQPPAAGMISQVGIKGTTAATLLVLLTEWLALRLQPTFAAQGVALPADTESRVVALTVSAPVMTRWSYLLSPGASDQFMQHVNVHQAAEKGYVPLQADPTRTASALRVRSELRTALGRPGDETAHEALGDDGFVVHNGQAYLPVGLDYGELAAACQPGSMIDHARKVLPHPNIDCILVSNSTSVQCGVNMHTGETAPVP